MLTIDLPNARRFILGRQGLWPGRRWRGLPGTEQAMQAMEFLQLDPLQIIARSHDIQLHSRVLDATPGGWEELAYTQRRFFDWGGWLATRPMADLPFWRVVMQRERDGHPDCDPRVRQNLHEHAAVVEEMRLLLRQHGTLGNRDFESSARTRTQSYRGRKDSALALYYMWRSGEVMTHHRENFERVYALTEEVAPADLLHRVDDDSLDRFLFKKKIAFGGISPLSRTADAYHRGEPFSRKEAIIESLLTDGEIIPVQVEGWRAAHYILASDLPLLDELAAGRIPPSWAPIETSSLDETVFLAPLDPVSARGRAAGLFGFDYIWEVYKPREQRKFGYYTLPVLWGERLVARFDSQFNKTSRKYTILGFWLEDETLAHDEAFAHALAAGFVRFNRFLDANALDAAAMQAPLLRRVVEEAVNRSGQ